MDTFRGRLFLWAAHVLEPETLMLGPGKAHAKQNVTQVDGFLLAVFRRVLFGLFAFIGGTESVLEPEPVVADWAAVFRVFHF